MFEVSVTEFFLFIIACLGAFQAYKNSHKKERNS